LLQSNKVADSLLAECLPTPGATLKRFREFVIYDASHAYPEFLVVYNRVK